MYDDFIRVLDKLFNEDLDNFVAPTSILAFTRSPSRDFQKGLCRIQNTPSRGSDFIASLALSQSKSLIKYLLKIQPKTPSLFVIKRKPILNNSDLIPERFPGACLKI